MSLTKNILIGVTGGIAAYKAAELVRLLIKQGHNVRVVMTDAAKAFIQPMTFQALTAHRVYDDLLDDQTDNAMAHIDLARWADDIIIAPASADIMAKISMGLANDLLTTICLATTSRVIIAPAMNQQMWLNTVTQEHAQRLQQRDVVIIGPDQGEQACGEVGPGRMMQPEQIVDQWRQLSQPAILKDQHWVITAGPTQEAIDPVRYLSNHSSGKMGYALAHAAVQLGAHVTLVSGPTALPNPAGVEVVNVISAVQMQQAVMAAMSDADGFIAAAAVADFRPSIVANQKIKKHVAEDSINLIKNPDILAEVSISFPNAFVAGFALETQDLLKHAERKLQAKGLDLIIANQLVEGETFGGDNNKVTVLTCDGKAHEFAQQPKSQLSVALMHFIHQYKSLPASDTQLA
ncbi:MAG: bifunctional phosphopantothenoylcysteine decarboxylase/phosphopantothenate--cysteine ligase CoaBC [Coxiellaceae bacterium]|nr:bifunctional phosphopantothenoylcysteine decarboxylase/phosphopantothenate--cysteine ligase CoaBC [Coxiellaceae bacterium]